MPLPSCYFFSYMCFNWNKCIKWPIITSHAIRPSEESLAYTLANLYVKRPVPRAIASTDLADVKFVGETAVWPLKTFVADTSPELADPITRAVR